MSGSVFYNFVRYQFTLSLFLNHRSYHTCFILVFTPCVDLTLNQCMSDWMHCDLFMCVSVFVCVCVCAQSDWDSFLVSVDEGLQTELSGGTIAESLSPETPFTDGRSGKWVCDLTLSVCPLATLISQASKNAGVLKSPALSCRCVFKGAWLWVSTWIRVRSCCWFSSDISDDCRDETTWPSWRPVRSVYNLMVQLTTSSLGYSIILSLYKNGIL